jgi:hypothetical protein
MCYYNGLSQHSDFIKSKKINTNTDTIQIDTLSIVPGSLIFLDGKNHAVDIDYYSAKLFWNDSTRNKS